MNVGPLPARRPASRVTRTLLTTSALTLLAGQAAAQAIPHTVHTVATRLVDLQAVTPPETVVAMTMCSHPRQGAAGAQNSPLAWVRHAIGPMRTGAYGAPVASNCGYSILDQAVDPAAETIETFNVLSITSGFAVSDLEAVYSEAEVPPTPLEVEAWVYAVRLVNWDWKAQGAQHGPPLSDKLRSVLRSQLEQAMNPQHAATGPTEAQLADFRARLAMLSRATEGAISSDQAKRWSQDLWQAAARHLEGVSLPVGVERGDKKDPPSQDERAIWWPFFITRVGDAGAIGTRVAILCYVEGGHNQVSISNISPQYTSEVVLNYYNCPSDTVPASISLGVDTTMVFTIADGCVTPRVQSTSTSRIAGHLIMPYLDRLKQIWTACFP